MPCMYSLLPMQVSLSLFTGESLCVPCSQGLLSRLSDFLLCRWSCRSCWQWCWECSCCQPTDEEVEILGPFPAQTPSWLWVHTRTTLIQCSHFTNNPEQFIIHLICLLSHHNSQTQIETDSIHSVTEQISRQSQRYHLSKACCWWMVCSGYVWNGILASCLLNYSQYELHICYTINIQYIGLGLVIF